VCGSTEDANRLGNCCKAGFFLYKEVPTQEGQSDLGTLLDQASVDSCRDRVTARGMSPQHDQMAALILEDNTFALKMLDSEKQNCGELGEPGTATLVWLFSCLNCPAKCRE